MKAAVLCFCLIQTNSLSFCNDGSGVISIPGKRTCARPCSTLNTTFLDHLSNVLSIPFVRTSRYGTPLSLSKLQAMWCIIVTDCPALRTACSVKLPHILFTMSLILQLICSLCRLHGMLRPNPPFSLINLPHFS